MQTFNNWIVIGNAPTNFMLFAFTLINSKISNMLSLLGHSVQNLKEYLGNFGYFNCFGEMLLQRYKYSRSF